MSNRTGGPAAIINPAPPRRLEVWTAQTPETAALVIDADTVRLILRDGMLPRATVSLLGVLLSGIEVSSVGPRVDELESPPVMSRRWPVWVVEADVPRPVFDEWRRLVVLPAGLDLVEQGRAMLELFAERRGEVLR